MPQREQWQVRSAQALPLIEKAVRDSPLKLNPRKEGQEILVPVPRQALAQHRP